MRLITPNWMRILAVLTGSRSVWPSTLIRIHSTSARICSATDIRVPAQRSSVAEPLANKRAFSQKTSFSCCQARPTAMRYVMKSALLDWLFCDSP